MGSSWPAGGPAACTLCSRCFCLPTLKHTRGKGRSVLEGTPETQQRTASHSYLVLLSTWTPRNVPSTLYTLALVAAPEVAQLHTQLVRHAQLVHLQDAALALLVH